MTGRSWSISRRVALPDSAERHTLPASLERCRTVANAARTPIGPRFSLESQLHHRLPLGHDQAFLGRVGAERSIHATQSRSARSGRCDTGSDPVRNPGGRDGRRRADHAGAARHPRRRVEPLEGPRLSVAPLSSGWIVTFDTSFFNLSTPPNPTIGSGPTGSGGTTGLNVLRASMTGSKGTYNVQVAIPVGQTIQT